MEQRKTERDMQKTRSRGLHPSQSSKESMCSILVSSIEQAIEKYSLNASNQDVGIDKYCAFPLSRLQQTYN